MGYVTKEQIEEARKVDLLSYFEKKRPDELRRICRTTYCTADHDSLKITSKDWHWYSQGIWGRNALDYLIQAENMEFTDAVTQILRDFTKLDISSINTARYVPVQRLTLPERNCDNRRLYGYLLSRGIDKEIIRWCIDNGLIYESSQYHNVVFVGYDDNGKAKYACYRGACSKRVMGECSGSSKEYSFRIALSPDNTVHVFESPIDLLSYATIEKMNGRDWKDSNMLSLGGVYGQNGNSYEMPKALKNYLERKRGLRNVVLHLDNDQTGRSATRAFADSYGSLFLIEDVVPQYGKDVNDTLMYLKRNEMER